MLNNFRESLKPSLEKLGAKFGSTGLSPNFWTGLGLALAFVSAIMYGLNEIIPPNIAAEKYGEIISLRPYIIAETNANARPNPVQKFGESPV
ncbi:MAG: hypothetical protein ACKO7N_09475, partial [Candidatus Nitrosotenuis sp.]